MTAKRDREKERVNSERGLDCSSWYPQSPMMSACKTNKQTNIYINVKVCKILKYETENGYSKRQKGVVVGMIRLHVDDFLMAGTSDCVNEMTDMSI